MNLRLFLSRFTSPLRRSKPCGCPYPFYWESNTLPKAHRVDDGETDDGERYIEYYCQQCQNRFKLEHTSRVDPVVNQ